MSASSKSIDMCQINDRQTVNGKWINQRYYDPNKGREKANIFIANNCLLDF